MRRILPWISVNNTIILQETAVVSVLDDGLQYGYGFFTTLKVREGIALFLDKHRERLLTSAQSLAIGLDQNFPKNVERTIQSVIEKNEITDGAIRITVTKGTSNNPTIVIHATNIDAAVHTVSVITVPDDRDLYKTIKMTYRVPHIIAMQKAQEQGSQDALFSQDGSLIESTYANIYSVNGGQIYTPSITGRALDSISRKTLLEQLPIREQDTSENTDNPMVLVSSLSIRVVEKINGKLLKQDEAFVSKIQKAILIAENQYIAAHKK
ncbi:MAG TPA: aminotransferase class IV [Candidatus Saccharimonadales bacterium]|nr:aminotransferase class IV [Candidatus Saccharimonadales bacterium]